MDTKQQPEALLMERAMSERPAFGTAPIRCGKTKCSWRGYETDLKQTPGTIGGMRCTTSICPKCGNDEYMFMTPGEIKAWERKKREGTPMTTHNTSGAADLPEAGCSKHHLIHCSQCRHDNMVRELRAENDRLTTQLAALAAGQATAAQQGVGITAGMEPAATVRTLGVVGVKFSGWTDYGCALPDGTKLYTEAQLQAQIAAAPQPSTTAQSADSAPAVSDLPPLPAPDLRDVGTKPQEIKEFLKGYATEYARTAIAARAPADSVLEDAALGIDAAFEAVRRGLCKLPRYSFYIDTGGGVRKVGDRIGKWIEFDEAHALFDPISVDAARKQGATHD